MPDVSPFRGALYNTSVAGPITDLVAPPYDVISPEARLLLHERSPHNITHVSLPDGSGDADRYAHAARLLDRWLADGILALDDQPTLYVYQQTFQVAAMGWRTRTGILGAVRLAPWGEGIHPHERTIPSHKEDRLRLLRATRSNVSPIFALYPDEHMEVEALWSPELSLAPVYEFADDADVVHRLWRLSSGVAADVRAALAAHDVYIADGHHRYETALAFRDEVASSEGPLPDDSPYNYVMMYLTNMDHPEGLVILPAHRVLTGVTREQWSRFDRRVGEAFDVETFDLTSDTELSCAHRIVGRMAELARDRHAFALYRGEGRIRLLTLRDTRPLDELRKRGRIQNSVDLDVPILHALLLEEYLGLEACNDGPECNVTYVVEADEAMRSVDSGEAGGAFLLNPSTVEQVRRVAAKGEKMPGKATYFYPKLISGLVVRLLSA